MNWIGWRLLAAIPTLLGVVVITFLLTRVLPGDPAVFFASNPSMSAQEVDAVRRALGLDASMGTQFWLYLTGLVHGDLGQSIVTGQSVTDEILRRLPASLELTIGAFCLALMVSLPLGVCAALRPGSWVDHICRAVMTLGVSMPTFVTGLLLIYLFYYLWGVVPEPTGQMDPFLARPDTVTGFLTLDAVIAGDGAALGSALGHILLPCVTMALFAIGPIARMMRAAALETSQSAYVLAARAHGLSPRQIVWSYTFRNAMVPVITMLGMTFSYMLGANVLVEKVFAWPGMGAFALNSLIALDYAPVQAFVLIMAISFVIVNLLTDMLTVVIDPRAKLV